MWMIYCAILAHLSVNSSEPMCSIKYTPVEHFYILQSTSAFTSPDRFNRWNPSKAIWGMEAGIQFRGITMAIGHDSVHSVDSLDKGKDSFDYVRASFVKEFQ